MKKGISIIIMSCVLGLSGCAFTHEVLQSEYDYRAEKSCLTTHNSRNSIHTPQNCTASYGKTYKNQKSDEKDKKDWKKSQ